MNVRHLAEALQEAAVATDYYRAVGPDLADRFLDEIDAAVARIVANPGAWAPLGKGIRRCRLTRFPYSVVYRVEGDEIEVYAIAHQRRRPGYWRTRVDA